MGKIGRVRHLVVPVAFSLCLAACASEPLVIDDVLGEPVHSGEEFKLVLGGEQVRLDKPDLILWFEEVVEDSRCAKGVTCVWEGNARARFRLRNHGDDESFELNTSHRFETQRRTPIGTLVLRRLEPQAPVTNPKQYVATLYLESAP